MQAVGLEQHETAFEIMQQAKELLHSLESEVCGISTAKLVMLTLYDCPLLVHTYV